MGAKILKEDEYLDMVSKFAAYIDSNENIIGVYATNEDALRAEKSHALKKLRNTYKYKIQMVIK